MTYKCQLCDYTYNANGTVASESYYSYTSQLNNGYYPIDYTSPDAHITKTLKTQTTYLYNSAGLCTQTQTIAYDVAVSSIGFQYHAFTYAADVLNIYHISL